MLSAASAKTFVETEAAFLFDSDAPDRYDVFMRPCFHQIIESHMSGGALLACGIRRSMK
jgi:hypothetical protein